MVHPADQVYGGGVDMMGHPPSATHAPMPDSAFHMGGEQYSQGHEQGSPACCFLPRPPGLWPHFPVPDHTILTRSPMLTRSHYPHRLPRSFRSDELQRARRGAGALRAARLG